MAGLCGVLWAIFTLLLDSPRREKQCVSRLALRRKAAYLQERGKVLYRVTHGFGLGARDLATNLATSKISMPVFLQNCSSVVPNDVAFAGAGYLDS